MTQHKEWEQQREDEMDEAVEKEGDIDQEVTALRHMHQPSMKEQGYPQTIELVWLVETGKW